MTVEPQAGYQTSVDASRHVDSDEQIPTMKGHLLRGAILVFALAVLFWRVFLFGETLIDVATLNNQLPWGYSAAASNYPYNRRDLTDTYVTREYFVVQSYRDGEFPLWNPYTMDGHPIYADGVTRTLSPFLLFYRIFDVPMGYSFARIAELMCAALLMYCFLIGIGISGNGALLGSLVFELSSHSMLHLTGLGWWGGLMWLPLIFLFADRAIRRRSYTQALLAGLCLAGQFFCGYLPNQIYYVGAVALYYLFFIVRPRKPAQAKTLGSKLAMLAVTLSAGLVLAATQWVPALELLSNSNRKIVGAELGYVYLPPWYGATLIFPNLFGTAYDTGSLTLFTALNVSHDHILYLGIASLIPIGFSLFWLRRTRRIEGAEIDLQLRKELSIESQARRERLVFFALLAAVSFLVMAAAPLYVPITRYIPVLQVIRVAVRAGVLFLFSASVLVAIGADLILEAGEDKLRTAASWARKSAFAIVSLGFFAVICSYAIKSSNLSAGAQEHGRIAFLKKAALLLTRQFTPPDSSILFSLSLIIAVAILLQLVARGRLTKERFVGCLIALLVVDLFWNSRQFNETFDRSRVYPRTETTDLLRSLPSGRVLVVPSDLESNRRVSGANEKIIAPPNTLLPYQIPTVTGKNQQFPKWYREYASLIEPQRNLSHVVFDQYRSKFLDLINVRYVLTYQKAPPLEGYQPIASSEDITIYENKNAMPRAFFARDVREARNPAEAISFLSDPGFDPRSIAVVEFSSNVAPNEFEPKSSTEVSNGSAPPVEGIATIIEDRRNSVQIQTDNSAKGLLVLSDNYYPGWHAFLDGAPVQVLRSNCTMRAINVPAGRHVISFAFMPASFFTALWISIGGGGLMALILLGTTLTRSRGNSHALRKDQKDS